MLKIYNMPIAAESKAIFISISLGQHALMRRFLYALQQFPCAFFRDGGGCGFLHQSPQHVDMWRQGAEKMHLWPVGNQEGGEGFYLHVAHNIFFVFYIYPEKTSARPVGSEAVKGAAVLAAGVAPVSAQANHPHGGWLIHVRQRAFWWP